MLYLDYTFWKLTMTRYSIYYSFIRWWRSIVVLPLTRPRPGPARPGHCYDTNYVQHPVTSPGDILGVTGENGDCWRLLLDVGVDGVIIGEHLLLLGEVPGLWRGSKSRVRFSVAQAIVIPTARIKKTLLLLSPENGHLRHSNSLRNSRTMWIKLHLIIFDRLFPLIFPKCSDDSRFKSVFPLSPKIDFGVADGRYVNYVRSYSRSTVHGSTY